MSIYFRNFPIIDYEMFKDGNTLKITNITKRFHFIEKILNNAILYYPYLIKEWERPDIVSHKLYSTVDYDWLILAVNQKFDPYYEWPLFGNHFYEYLEEKYGTWQASTQLIKEYRLITTPEQTLNDGTKIAEKSLVIDQEYYLTLPDFERKVVYAFDWEEQKNEERRKIKTLDPVYLSQVISEKEQIFK